MSLNCSSLKAWFLAHQRDLPWRNHPSPYAVWISEVMLQQTQVAVVIPYFQRWMEKFPDIPALAKAQQIDVIKAWEGLGYYSRARNLHAGAQYILEHFDGKLPSNPEQLKCIKGLGPYTIGAIRSFAFRQKAAAVDGNVLRVLARYRMLEADISKQTTVKEVSHWLENQLPDQEPWLINEALIELGATVCKRKADCSSCPLRSDCLSFRHGRQSALPIKGKSSPLTVLYRSVPVIQYQDYFLTRQVEKGEIMQDLHEFPYFETEAKGWSDRQVLSAVARSIGLKCQIVKHLPPVKHSFTRFRATLSPLALKALHFKEVDGYQWQSADRLRQLAFSAGHRKIGDHFLKSPLYLY